MNASAAEFLPKVAMLVATSQFASLPVRTSVMLMRHYACIVDSPNAEDALIDMLDVEPDKSGIADFGITFYERLRSQKRRGAERS